MTCSPQHRRLVDRLTAAGKLPPQWLEAFTAVPRHAFVPADIWEATEAGLVPVRRGDDPAGWLDRVYADEPIITQADDGRTAPGEVGRYPSSSSSAPSVVARMLRALDAEEEMRVLEVGTGTGWNAGLLTHRLGAANVTTVEVDPAVAAQGSKALADAGLSPTVVTGDGAEGFAPHAPYGRVLATASVARVPYPWVAQTRPGGVILTPWGTAYHNSVMAKLTVGSDGTACGRFVGQLAFMWLRSQRIPFGSVEDRVRDDDATGSVTELHPYEPVSDYDASFAIGLGVPGCQTIVAHADDDPQRYVLWLMDPASGSWASLAHEPEARRYPVRQHGPRMLWDEVERAYHWWVDAGRPELSRFGLTVTPRGQHVWLDEPGSTVG